MRANFERSLHLVLQSEGGFVDNPSDPGGATNKGVTIASYRAYVDPHGTVDDLKRLTEVQAGAVYRKEYWDKIRGDDLPAGVDYALFDFAVNSGTVRAARTLQFIANVTIDGVLGPQTIAAVQGYGAKSMIVNICDRRLAFLQQLPAWLVFGKGWTNRVASVRSVALGMAVL